MKKLKVALALAALATLLATNTPSRAEGGEEPQLVATDTIGDAALSNDPTTAPAGVDIVAAYVHQPDYDVPSLEFIFQMSNDWSLPTGPEVVRYLWEIGVDGAEYWIQAKISDITTAPATADDPAGTVQRAGQLSIRLRGNCLAPGAITTCHHVAWLDGTIDVAAHQVRATVPFSAAPEFKAGSHILPWNTGNSPNGNIETGFQAGVTEPNTTTDTMDQCAEYVIPTNGVSEPVEGCE